MTSPWALILPLALGTIAIRFAGALLGQRIPAGGPWARAARALPGSLIIALVAVNLVSGGPREWTAAFVAVLVAVASRNLLMTMAAGIAAIWILRHAL